jgi:hypothetical protein
MRYFTPRGRLGLALPEAGAFVTPPFGPEPAADFAFAAIGADLWPSCAPDVAFAAADAGFEVDADFLAAVRAAARGAADELAVPCDAGVACVGFAAVLLPFAAPFADFFFFPPLGPSAAAAPSPA